MRWWSRAGSKVEVSRRAGLASALGPWPDESIARLADDGWLWMGGLSPLGREDGFTLVELLIGIAIAGMLIAVIEEARWWSA